MKKFKKIHENSDYPLEYICKMDETPVYLDLVPNMVVDKKGKKRIKQAQEIIERKGTIVKKSFSVTGIANSQEELIRNDSVYQEIQSIMDDVFGSTHMGLVEPTDQYADEDSSSDENPGEEDPFNTSTDPD